MKPVGKKGLKIVFLWHWQKRLTDEEKPVFAVPDSLINAAGRLSSDYIVKLVAFSKERDYEVHSAKQNIDYIFRTSLEGLMSAVTDIDPDILLINHNPNPYEKLQKMLNRLRAKKIIYYSAPIKELNQYHKKIEYHLVHHKYQKEILKRKGIDPKKIVVSPKTADMEIFNPGDIEKKWDCIYPMRGGMGYWKRAELAIEACKLNNMLIVMPGAKIPPEYSWVTTFGEWKSPKEMARLYNQSKCLVITSNEKEMGPRVIPEAAACNIPIVCCSDSPACVSHVKRIGGFVAEPNPKDLAEKIKLALQEKLDSRRRMDELGFDYDLNYRTLSNLIKNDLLPAIGSQKNSEKHWNKKYGTGHESWAKDWRLTLYDWAAEDIGEQKYSIVDVGSGLGYGLERIKKYRPMAEICGIDFSEEAEKNSVVPFVRKNILTDDLSSLSADYVLCVETLEHFKDPAFVLGRILAIAKKKLILTVPYNENISRHTEHESVFSKQTFRGYNLEKIEVRQRSAGRVMKIVIKAGKPEKKPIHSILRRLNDLMRGRHS